MKLFGTNKKDKKPVKSETSSEFMNVGNKENTKDSGSVALPKEYGVLKGFYVSEKATSLGAFNQYVFKIFDNTTKNEVRKQVEKSFDVKVKEVKTINLPKKRRVLGRRIGFKRRFRKAIVVLEKGQTIEQAKA